MFLIALDSVCDEIGHGALRTNRPGDPALRQVAVYLPEGYDQGTDDYPLFVDLVGFTGIAVANYNHCSSKSTRSTLY